MSSLSRASVQTTSSAAARPRPGPGRVRRRLRRRRRDAAVEKTTEATLDVTRQPEAVRRPIPRILQHGLEMVGDHSIERGRLRPARLIAARQRRCGGAPAAFEDCCASCVLGTTDVVRVRCHRRHQPSLMAVHGVTAEMSEQLHITRGSDRPAPRTRSASWLRAVLHGLISSTRMRCSAGRTSKLKCRRKFIPSRPSMPS